MSFVSTKLLSLFNYKAALITFHARTNFYARDYTSKQQSLSTKANYKAANYKIFQKNCIITAN